MKAHILLFLCQCLQASYATGAPPTPTPKPTTTTAYPTITQSDKPCPDGWVDGNELGCYKFLSSVNSLTWVEAQNKCELEGGFLAEPKTSSMMEFVTDLAGFTEQLTGVSEWFLGLSDLGHEGEWSWMHAQEPVTEFMWAGDRPTPYPSNRDCGLLRLEKGVGYWYDIECSQEWKYASPICQYEPQEETTPEPTATTPVWNTTTIEWETTTNSNGRCPYDWVQFAGNCYKYNIAHVNWIQAEMACQSVGSNLASVHSEEENAFLRALALEVYGENFDFWIGGYFFDRPAWTDQTKFDFEFFHGSPSGDGCLYLYDNYEEWIITSSCDSSTDSFVCKIIL